MQNLFKTNRLVYWSPPPSPDAMKGPETTTEIPKAEEITAQHIDEVVDAADKNIKIIEDYYKDYVTTDISGEKMPKNIEEQLQKLTALKTKLQQMRYNPKASRDTLIQVYRIFGDLDEHALKTREGAAGDPLKGLGIISSLYRPILSTEKPDEKATAVAAAKPKETKEQANKRLVLEAVTNIAQSGGEITQEMMDALKGYKPNVSPLRFDITIDGNPVTMFVERSDKGFVARGSIINEKELPKGAAPTWARAPFNYSHSFDATDESAVSIPMKTDEQYMAMIKSNKLPPEALA